MVLLILSIILSRNNVRTLNLIFIHFFSAAFFVSWLCLDYQYENTVLNAFREVEDALVEIETFNEQLESDERAYIAADNAARLSSSRYYGGVSSYLEVLETERSLFTAELQLSQTRQQTFSSYIRLYKALGGGWITKEEYVEDKNRNQQEK